MFGRKLYIFKSQPLQEVAISQYYYTSTVIFRATWS